MHKGTANERMRTTARSQRKSSGLFWATANDRWTARDYADV